MSEEKAIILVRKQCVEDDSLFARVKSHAPLFMPPTLMWTTDQNS